MRSPTCFLAVAPVVMALALGACKDASDNEIASGEIGPDGGLLTSADSILTIAIQPGALDETITLTIQRSDEPPDVYGPAFRVQPNLELNVPATVTYRYTLPEDTSETAIGYVDATEFIDGTGRWRALPVVRLDAAQKLVTGTDPEISLFYGLLDAGGSPPPTSGTGTGGSDTNPTETTPGTATVDPDTGATTMVDPDTGATTMVDPDTGPGETTTVDPDTGPGEESTDTGEETTGNPIGCGNLPMPPLAVDEFMFDGTPLDGNSEDMTFSTIGSLITRNGADLVQISPAGTVTPIPTMVALPEPTLGTRWTPTGTIITAGQNTNEILEIQADGTVDVLLAGLNLPNGIYVANNGDIFYTEFFGERAAVMTAAGAPISELGQGGSEAPSTNGIVYDPDRDLVFWVSYYAGVIYRADVSDLANPGNPDMIATVPLLGGGDVYGLDGLALDECGNLYIVDQNQDAPGSLFRLELDAAGDPIGAPEALVEAFPDGVANVVFAQGPGWEAFNTTVFTVGLPGRIFTVDVGVEGAPTPAG